MDPVTGAAVGAVGKAVKKAAQDDPVVDGVLVDQARASGELDVAASARAKREAVKQVVRLRVVQPIGRALGMPKDYFELKFEDELAARMAAIPDENITPPRLSLASPAINGIRITVDEPELRNLYLNLLASASDAATAEAVHPSFAGVIGSLTAEEAVALQTVLLDDIGVVEVLAVSGEEQLTVATNIIRLAFKSDGEFVARYGLYVTNWIRLGLCEIQWDRRLADESHYHWIDTNQVETYFRGRVSEAFGAGAAMTIIRGSLRVTDFGTEFHRVVVQERVS